MRKIFIFSMFILLSCVFLSGCNPDNRRTVESQLNSVLTIKYKYVSTEVVKPKYVPEERKTIGNRENIYHFEDQNGVEFYVSSGYRSGNQPFSTKSNICNYAKVQIEVAKEIIEKAAKSDLHTEWIGYDYRINIHSYDDLERAAACVENVLKVTPPFSINRENFQRYFCFSNLPGLPEVEVFCADELLCISSFYFLCDGETLPTQLQILDELQYEYSDTAKRGYIKEDLPDEVLLKYPVSIISSIYLNNEKLADPYKFTFSRSLNEYMINNLDPCQDFEGSSNYSNKGTFAFLVESLGGTYECEDWKASWTIGNNTWNATLKTKRKREYVSMKIYKNGEKIDLSETNESNGTISGRAFTLSDLEKMLGVTAEVDQREHVIHLRSNL